MIRLQVVDVLNKIHTVEVGFDRFLGVHANGIARASFDTIATVNTAEHIDGKGGGKLFSFGVRAFFGGDVNTASRAGCGTEHARRAANRTVIAQHEAMFGAVADVDGLFDFRPRKCLHA